MWSTIAEGRDWEGELVNRRKDGTSYREVMTISPVRDATGEIAHYIGVKRDITRERELELQLRQSQRLEAIGTLAGGVAHDFNNLLTVIGGYDEVALDLVPEGHPAREALEEIQTAVNRAGDLTRQLLAFSRKQVVQPRLIEPNALVTGIVKMLRPLLGENIDLVCDLADDAPGIFADPRQIEQVITNLSVNGRDAMPRGGTLTILSRRVESQIHWPEEPWAPPGEYLLLEVRDCGSGMDAETLSRAFEPFFTTKEQGKGTGLGLATVHGIVEQAGGHIRLMSRPGEGTSCQLLFPPTGGDVTLIPDLPTAERKAARRGGGELILVVEDDLALLELTCRFLRSAGYRVMAAPHSDEALATMARIGAEVALVVSDVILPGLSGPELIEKLRDVRPELPGLFVSGYAADKLQIHGTALAEIPLLGKPFTRSQLLAAVERELRRQIAEPI